MLSQKVVFVSILTDVFELQMFCQIIKGRTRFKIPSLQL